MNASDFSGQKEGQYYERISPTAWGVAYQRTFTDIPFSAEIFARLDALMREGRTPAEMRDLEGFEYSLLAPMFEARFKLTTLLLAESGAQSIVELAAGFSPRGMAMGSDPAITYVETDLPGVIEQKRMIVDDIFSGLSKKPTLYLEEGNALVMNDLQAAARHFKSGPIAVVNEGLLRYLTFPEQANVAANVHALLSEHGGVWMTPDINARDMMATGVLKEAVREQNRRMTELTGIDVRKNYFESEEHARAFFEEQGFCVERHPFTEVSHMLVSPERARLSDEQVADAIGKSAVYMMHVEG